MLDFPLKYSGIFSDLLRENGCQTFLEACNRMQELPYGRNAVREDLKLVFSEGKGTCSSKHAILAYVALEQHHPEVEIIAGIFMMSGETHWQLEEFFHDKPYSALPECHCYLRYKGERFDYTSRSNPMALIAPKIVREQRMDPHQAIDWKVNIHKNYIEGWLRRNPQLEKTPEEIWSEREECIRLMENSTKKA